MNLTYRMNTSADKDELVRLWSTETGWDDIDSSVWEHRFVHTPFGEAAIALAIDEDANKIVGQLVFIPLIALVDGREVSAYRPYAVFLTKSARSFQGLNPLTHPMLKMYRLAVDSFKHKGIELIYMLPDPLWARAFRFLPNFQIGSFPLWSLKLPLTESFALLDGYKAVEVEVSDKRLNELWEKSAKLYDCSIVRNSKSLAWRHSHFTFFYRAVERNGELAGFAALLYKGRDRQLVLCDLLAADTEALRATLAAACNSANEYRLKNPEQPIDKIAVLTTKLLQPIVEDLDFYRDKYNFLLVIQTLNSSLTEKQIAPSRWSASAND